MDFFDQPAYSAIKKATAFAGIWPLQPFHQRWTRIPVGVTIFIIAVIILGWQSDYKTFLECVPSVLNMLALLAKYMNGACNVKKLRKICHMIKNNSERFMDLPEHEILDTCVSEGRKIGFNITVIYTVVTIIFVIPPTALIVEDIITKNSSEAKYLMYKANYIFFDVQDYYYLATLQSYISTVLFTAFMSVYDTMYLMFTQHGCALFRIVGYHLQRIHVLDTVALKKAFGPGKYEELIIDEQERMYQALKLCIKEHKEALEYADVIQSAFSVSIFAQLLMNIVCISLTGIQILLSLIKGRIPDLVRFATWVLAQVIHLFFLCAPGQRLADYSGQVYYEALESMWYRCFKKSVVLYQTLVIKTMTPVQLTAMKVMSLNRETFLSVMQTAFSYFTVLSTTL